MLRYSHSTETEWDSTLVSATSWLTAWHWMLMVLSVGATFSEMLVTVLQPPFSDSNLLVWFPCSSENVH